MKSIKVQTNNWTKRDSFNSKACMSLKDIAGKVLTVRKCAVGTDVDENGEEIETATLVCEEGTFGTISATAIDMCYDLIEMLDDEGSLRVGINMRKANNGRDYIVLELVD